MFKRNWLKEAFEIAHGSTKIPPKKEHVHAAIMAINELGNDMENIRKFMRTAYEEACRIRQERGQSLPPRPPGLEGGFQWPNRS